MIFGYELVVGLIYNSINFQKGGLKMLPLACIQAYPRRKTAFD